MNQIKSGSGMIWDDEMRLLMSKRAGTVSNVLYIYINIHIYMHAYHL
jgi:hypothetical protein